MRRLLFSLLLLSSSVLPAQQVTIIPRFPQRGQPVTITWHPERSGIDHPSLQPEKVTLVFTYSNLYELPLKIDLKHTDSGWSTAFVLPRYATFATFYLQAGDTRITPPEGGHYELAVYRDEKTVVKSGYLYKAYSLSAQRGRTPHLADDQAALYQKELTIYPDNYEARVRLYQYEISHAPAAQQGQILEQAHAFIAAKFESDPTSMGNLNYVTMGYLILGENSRLDSIHQVVINRYPHLPIGKELLTDLILKEKDSAKMISRLEQELNEETPAGKEAYGNMHEILFEYYAAHGDNARALLHARGMLPDVSPYLPEVLLHITRTLAESGLAPDTALAYARRSLLAADSFPAGIIRYFPETGYIPSYVSDSLRHAVVQKAKGNTLALMSLIYANKHSPLAGRLADSAITLSPDEKTLTYAAKAYDKSGLPDKAYAAWHRLILQAGTMDTAVAAAMAKDYRLWKGSTQGWDKEWEGLLTAKRTKLTNALRQQRLNAPAPSLDSIVDLSGNPVLPESLKGRVIVIDFWATWCMPCMEEMPYLQKVYDVYKKDPRVTFMVINSGARNTLQDAQRWFGNKKYSFPVYFHTNPAVGDIFGFNVIPAVFVIDPEGRLQFKTIGFEGPDMEEKLDAEIKILLKE